MRLRAIDHTELARRVASGLVSGKERPLNAVEIPLPRWRQLAFPSNLKNVIELLLIRAEGATQFFLYLFWMWVSLSLNQAN